MSSLKDRFLSFMKPNAGASKVSPSTASSDSGSAVSDAGKTQIYDDATKQIIDQKIASAREEIKSGNLEKALDQLVDVVAEFKDHQEANALTGALLLTFQQVDIAEDLLYHAVRLSNWTDVNSVANLAVIMRQRGDTELALKALTMGYVIGTNSTDSDGVLSLQFAETYRNISDFTKAREWYLAAALKMKESEDAWLRASTLLFPEQHRDLKIAENVLLEGVSRNRNSSELIFYLGYVMYSTDRSDAAITFFQQALRLNENNTEAISALAVAYHTKRDLNTAFQYYNAYVRRNANNAGILANFALLLSEMNRNADAEKVLSRAYDIDANDPIVIRIMKQLNAVPATSP